MKEEEKALKQALKESNESNSNLRPIEVTSWKYHKKEKQIVCYLSNHKSVVIKGVTKEFLDRWQQMNLADKTKWIVDNQG